MGCGEMCQNEKIGFPVGGRTEKLKNPKPPSEKPVKTNRLHLRTERGCDAVVFYIFPADIQNASTFYIQYIIHMSRVGVGLKNKTKALTIC